MRARACVSLRSGGSQPDHRAKDRSAEDQVFRLSDDYPQPFSALIAPRSIKRTRHCLDTPKISAASWVGTHTRQFHRLAIDEDDLYRLCLRGRPGDEHIREARSGGPLHRENCAARLLDFPAGPLAAMSRTSDSAFSIRAAMSASAAVHNVAKQRHNKRLHMRDPWATLGRPAGNAG
jgi:hypothetical protein